MGLPPRPNRSRVLGGVNHVAPSDVVGGCHVAVVFVISGVPDCEPVVDITQLLVLSLPDLTVRQQIKLPVLGNLTESMPLWAPPDSGTQQIEALALSPDRKHLAVGCSSAVLLYRLAWTTD